MFKSAGSLTAGDFRLGGHLGFGLVLQWRHYLVLVNANLKDKWFLLLMYSIEEMYLIIGLTKLCFLVSRQPKSQVGFRSGPKIYHISPKATGGVRRGLFVPLQSIFWVSLIQKVLKHPPCKTFLNVRPLLSWKKWKRSKNLYNLPSWIVK